MAEKVLIMESYRRSVVKALSYRVIGTFATTLVALTVTGQMQYALTIGLLDSVAKTGLYVAHERLWNRISFGRPKAPEYQI